MIDWYNKKKRSEKKCSQFLGPLQIPNLELLQVSPTNDSYILTLKSTRTSNPCPSCSKLSSRIHSQYTRRVQDLPISGKPVELLVLTRRWFCDNPDCKVIISQNDLNGFHQMDDVPQGQKKFFVK